MFACTKENVGNLLKGLLVTVTKRALLNSSLPVPRSTADENSNHNNFIIEEERFTMQFTLVMESAVHQFIS